MDERLLMIFRAEADERLDKMVQTLLAIEAGQGDAESVRELFRHAHSLKGTAGMVGLDAIGKVAGAVEDVLAEARTSGRLAAAQVGPLLTVTDALRGAMEGAPLDADAVVAALQSQLADGERDAPAQGPGPADRRPVSEGPPAAKAPPAEESPAADTPQAGADRLPSAATPTPAQPPAAAEASSSAPSPAPAAPAGAALASRRRNGTLRVSAERVDAILDVAGQAVVGMRRWEHIVGAQLDDRMRDELESGAVLMGSLQEAALRLRTLPLSTIVGPFSRAVRDIAAAEGKEAELELVGVDVQLDRVILDGVGDLIVHLLRNAVSHGIEPPDEREALGKPRAGKIVVRAETISSGVLISVSDDGRGVSRELRERAPTATELADLLSTPGLSTAAQVGDLSGRGVGLDAVRRDAEALGGGLLVESEPGRGSDFMLRMPITLAVLGLLLVERAGQVFGMALIALEEVVDPDSIVTLGDVVAVDVRGEAIQLVDLADLLSLPAAVPASGPVLVIQVLERRVAIRVDRLLGEQEAVVKSLGPVLANVPGYLGATLLQDGTIGLILDPRHAVRVAASVRGAAPVTERRALPAAPDAPPRVLVVDDQHTVRELQRTILTGAGYDVVTARDGREALDLLADDPHVRLVLTDIEMPVLDGFGLLLALRDDERFSALPVIVVSSRGGEEDRRRGAEAGADAYVDKAQFDQRTLLATVERLVDR